MEHKVSNNIKGLLPDGYEIDSLEVARKYSDFCEATYRNVIAFSPYQLTIDREDFLHFQEYADELLAELSHGTTLDKVKSLYFELNALYKKLMQCCWSAFARYPRIDSEPGLFVVNQMQTVGEFIHALQAK